MTIKPKQELKMGTNIPVNEIRSTSGARTKHVTVTFTEEEKRIAKTKARSKGLHLAVYLRMLAIDDDPKKDG